MHSMDPWDSLSFGTYPCIYFPVSFPSHSLTSFSSAKRYSPTQLDPANAPPYNAHMGWQQGSSTSDQETADHALSTTIKFHSLLFYSCLSAANFGSMRAKDPAIPKAQLLKPAESLPDTSRAVISNSSCMVLILHRKWYWHTHIFQVIRYFWKCKQMQIKQL